MVDNNRKLWKWILLSIVTCGIYAYYFIYKLAQDVNTICDGDGKKTPGLGKFILLSLCTCGIYPLIWWYGVANRLQENAPRYGLTFSENGTTFVMWQLFGSALCGIGPFIAMNIIIKNTNALAERYLAASPAGFRNEEVQTAATPLPETPVSSALPETPAPSPLPAPAQPLQQTGRISGAAGSLLGAEIEIQPGDLIIIGRDPMMSQLILTDSKVSRKHCGIRFDSATTRYIVECYSTNGLRLSNGQMLVQNQKMTVEPGTSLIFGDGQEVLDLV